MCCVASWAGHAAGQEAAAQPRKDAAEVVRVAIYKDDIPACGGAASPDYLARLLEAPAFSTAFLNSEQLADARSLTRERFDVLVLPYGASFPVRAADNFRKFLRDGGKFFSTGGYAFDNLLERTAAGWQPPAPPPPPESEHVVWHYEIPAAQLRGKGRLTFSGFLKAAKVEGPGMAYFAVYQFAADGSIVQWIDFAKVTGTHDWEQFSHRFNVRSNTARVDFQAGLYRCSGTAWFDDVRLEDQEGRPILTDGFEEEFNPDVRATNHWWRSDARFCVVQSETRHSGQRALQAKLNFHLTQPERLNTRHGLPADGLEVAPTQLGVFDADYRLQRTAWARAAPHQSVIRSRPLYHQRAAGRVGGSGCHGLRHGPLDSLGQWLRPLWQAARGDWRDAAALRGHLCRLKLGVLRCHQPESVRRLRAGHGQGFRRFHALAGQGYVPDFASERAWLLSAGRERQIAGGRVQRRKAKLEMCGSR